MPTPMQLIKEYATQYEDGLITAKEMITRVCLEIADQDGQTAIQDYATEFANELATQLLK